MEASSEITPLVLGWYDGNARALPWRAPPGTPAPPAYRVWLAEIMLQQTTVAAVIPHYDAFTRRWPCVSDLAAADDADVMAAWAGLGYYARARNLLACARAVEAAGGRFPESEAELRRLPGLGAYTAAAVAAIAFGSRAVAIDANVERVVARLFAIGDPLPGAKAAIRVRAGELLAPDRPGDFTQAMMDLGATICTARNPRCAVCPVHGSCRAVMTGQPEAFPAKPRKKARPERRGAAFRIERDGAIWLVRRPAKGMLGGMRALPDDGWSAKADGAGMPLAGPWTCIGEVCHGFTHFTLRLKVMQYSGAEWHGPGFPEGVWWPRNSLDEAGLPTLFARAARLAMTGKDG